MQFRSLKGKYLEELREIYDAESRLANALPKISLVASSPELRAALNEFAVGSGSHASRLEELFQGVNGKIEGKTCCGMKGI